jgi:hypothetical protein
MWSPDSKVRLRSTVLMPVVAFGTKTSVSAGALRTCRKVVRAVTDDQMLSIYFSHGLPGHINESGIVVADEVIRPGFCGVLEAAHLIANGSGICSEGS